MSMKGDSGTGRDVDPIIRNVDPIIKRFGLSVALLAIATGVLSCSRLESTGTPVAPTTGTLASLNGIVSDMTTRTPLPGVFVSVAGAGMTGVDGRYAFTALRGGDALLTGRRQGLANFSQTVSLYGARTIDIPMKPPTSSALPAATPARGGRRQ